jgi:hypothetical protein
METYIAKGIMQLQQHFRRYFYKDIKRLKPAHCFDSRKNIEEIYVIGNLMPLSQSFVKIRGRLL